MAFEPDVELVPDLETGIRQMAFGDENPVPRPFRPVGKTRSQPKMRPGRWADAGFGIQDVEPKRFCCAGQN